MAKVEIKGSVERIVRANGKAEAQVLLLVPMDQVLAIPMGKVSVTMESVQGALFSGAVRGDKTGERRSPVRGGRTPAPAHHG